MLGCNAVKPREQRLREGKGWSTCDYVRVCECGNRVCVSCRIVCGKLGDLAELGVTNGLNGDVAELFCSVVIKVETGLSFNHIRIFFMLFESFVA